MPEAQLIFITADEARARASIGQRFLVGAVPYRATDVREVSEIVWQVLGVPLDVHPEPG